MSLIDYDQLRSLLQQLHRIGSGVEQSDNDFVQIDPRAIAEDLVQLVRGIQGTPVTAPISKEGNENDPLPIETQTPWLTGSSDQSESTLSLYQSDGLVTSLLFDTQTGVLQFIRQSAHNADFALARATLLDNLVSDYILRFVDVALAHHQSICETCMMAFAVEKSAVSKKACLEPLLALMVSSRRVPAEVLNVSALFDRLLNVYRTQHTQLRPAVNGRILEVLGAMASRYSTSIQSRGSELIRLMIQAAEKELSKRDTLKVELLLLAGTVRGLDGCVQAFGPSGPDGNDANNRLKLPDQADRIFAIVDKTVCPPENLNRYDVPRAALAFIAHHSAVYSERLLQDYRALYQSLVKMCTHRNSDLQKLGFRALEAFMKAVAERLGQLASGTVSARDCFWFFMIQFSETLKEARADTAGLNNLQKTAMAVRGFGYFAGACAVHGKTGDLELMMDDLLAQCSWVFGGATDKTDTVLYHLASFLQALGNMIDAFGHASKSLPTMVQSTAEQMVNVLLLHFVRLPDWQRVANVRSLVHVLAALFSNYKSISTVLIQPLIFQALVMTCNDALAAAARRRDFAELDITNEFHAYEDYLQFWSSLFNPQIWPKKVLSDEIYSILYDSFMEALMRLLHDLDLTLKEENKVDDDSTPTEETAEVQKEANVPKDFLIFVRAVDFVRQLLPRLSLNAFANWYARLCCDWVEMSLKRPMISGFYKLIAMALQLGGSLTLVQGHVSVLVDSFLQDVLKRMHLYKDDLLASCLTLVLTAANLHLLSIHQVLASLQMALKLGLTFSPLISLALQSLEEWHTSADMRLAIAPFYPQILPLLNDYLLLSGDLDGVDRSNTAKDGASNAAQRRRRALGLKSVRSSGIALLDAAQEQSLLETRLRILRLLGLMGGSSQHLLYENDKNKEYFAIDIERRVKYKLCFGDQLKIDIFLDDLLQRIIELATNSAERKLKVAAGELLHAIMIYVLGQHVHRVVDATNSAESSAFIAIFERFFPASLLLAIDIESVTRALFKPLVMQMIHLFTNSARYETPEAVALLQSALDAICQPDNGPLRDFGATCLAEFFKYAIKQQTNSSSSPAGVKSLLKRLYILASHPNPSQRSGAAMTLMRILPMFHHDENILDEFALECLDVALLSIRLSHHDAATTTGSVDEISQFCRKLVRLIRRFESKFRKSSNTRKCPPSLASADFQSLAAWLFTQIARPEHAYSRLCMELFDQLIPYLDKSPQSWLVAQGGITFILKTCETEQVLDFTTLAGLELYISSLDAFTWLIGHGWWQANDILQQSRNLSKLTEAFTTLEQYSLSSYVSSQFVLPHLLQQIMATFTVKTLFFCQTVLSHSGLLNCLNSVFFKVISKCTFEPETFGFELERPDVANHLQSLLRELWTFLYRQLKGTDFIPLAESCYFTIENTWYPTALTLLEQAKVLPRILAVRSKTTLLFKQELLDKILNEVSPSASKRSMNGALLSFLLASNELNNELLHALAKQQCDLYSENVHRHLVLNWSYLAPILHEDILSETISSLLFTLSQTSFASIRGNFLIELLKGNSMVAVLNKWRIDAAAVTGGLNRTLLRFMKQLLVLDTQLLTKVSGSIVVTELCEIYLTFLSRSVPLMAKLDALDLLSSFLIITDDAWQKQLSNALSELITYQFPLTSRTYDSQSSSYEVYAAALNKLLAALENSKSPMMLRLLLPVTCREPDHAMADAIDSSMRRFVRSLSSSTLQQVLQDCFSIFSNSSYPVVQRATIIRLHLLPFLRDVSNEVLILFICTHVKSLVAQLAVFAMGSDAQLKSCVFGILQIAYERLPVESLNSPSSAVNLAFCGVSSTGKELTQALVKTSHTIVKSASSLEYRCAAFNCLSAVIIKTQSQENVYKAFLLSVVDQTVDVDQKVQFSVEQNVSKRYVNGAVLESSQRPNLQYLSSSYLADSSLSQMPGMSWSEKLEPTTRSTSVIEILEFDDVNASPCMSSVLAIVDRLKSIIPVNANDMSVWMKEILEQLSKPSAHLNTRLFLVKVILNRAAVFQPFASVWMRPMLRVVSDGLGFGEGINSFVRDVCVQLLEWRALDNLTAEDVGLASSFLSFLFSRVHHERKAILRNGLEIIKGILEALPIQCHVPVDLIQELISSQDELKPLTGIQLLGAVVANKWPPCPATNVTTSAAVMDALMMHLSVTSKYYAPAAEVSSMLLSLYRNLNALTMVDALEQRISTKMRLLNPVQTNGKTLDRFVIALVKMSLHDKHILEPFMLTLLHVLPSLQGQLKTFALETLAVKANEIEDLFDALLSKDLLGLIRHREDQTQLAVLMLIRSLSDQLTLKQWRAFFDLMMETFTVHPNPACRRLLYGILAGVFERSKEMNALFHSQVKTGLLRGLLDEHDETRNAVIAFWNDGKLLPDHVVARTLELLGPLYEPAVEEAYLHFGSFLLLDVAEKASGSIKIFDEPLPNAKFDRHLIDAAWHHSALMTPLFVPTQQLSMALDERVGEEDEESIGLRATPSSIDLSQTLNMSTAAAAFTLGGSISQSSLLFSNRTHVYLGTPSETLSATSTQQRQYAPLRRRFMPVSSTAGVISASQQSFAFKQMAEKQRRLKKIRQQLAERQRDVHLHRDYRIGELPDIEISHADILRPLKVVAQWDVEFARQLFAVLVGAVARLAGGIDASFKPQLQQNMIDLLTKVSCHYAPVASSLLRLCFDLNSNSLLPDLPVEAVSRVALLSGNVHQGVVLVEALLLEKEKGDTVTVAKPSKRARIATVASTPLQLESKDWFTLSQLYKSLHDTAIDRAIDEQKLASHSLVKKALHFEWLGALDAAFDLYKQVMEEDDSALDAVERELCHKASLSCLKRLGDWDSIVLDTLSNADWESTFWQMEVERQSDFIVAASRIVDGLPNEQGIVQPWSRENNNPLVQLVSTAMKDIVQRSFLYNQHAFELLLSALYEGDWDKTHHFLRHAQLDFLSSWSSLHPMAVQLKREQLGQLLPLFDVHEFLANNQHLKRDEAKLSSHWHWRLPSNESSSREWDATLQVRRLLSAKHNHSNELHYLQAFANEMRQQGEFDVAEKCLRSAASQGGQVQLGLLSLQLERFKVMQERNVSVYLELFKESINLKDQNLQSLVLVQLTSLIQEDASLLPSLQSKVSSLKAGFDVSSVGSFSMAVLKTLDKSSFSSYARYSDALIRWHEQHDERIPSDLIKINVQSTLNAMKQGHDSSIFMLFPRVLSLIAKEESAANVFENVPLTKLIWNWLPQIMAHASSNDRVCDLLYPLLLQMAKESPQPVYYALGCCNNQNTKLFSLLPLVRSPLLDIFIQELSHLTDAPHILRAWMDKQVAHLSAAPVDKDQMKTDYHQLYSELLNPDVLPTGSERYKFATKHGKALRDLAGGENGSLLMKMTLNEFQRTFVKYVHEKMERDHSPSSAAPLVYYSPWLAQFHAANHTESLQLPGHFDEDDLCIHSFDSRLLVLQSLRRPKRLTMVASNGKRYSFLVKGGEDIRVDERVQQLLRMMRQLATGNGTDSLLMTYRVVPMTLQLGVIEWLEQTRPLKLCIEKESLSARDKAIVMHQEFIQQQGDYPKMLGTLTATQATQCLAQLSANAPDQQSLRRHLQRLAASPEAQLYVRQKFVHSLASICVAHYILGVGDRHLDNFLLSLDSGALIGIDFGMALGAAVAWLRVPELVPFRMTRLIRGCLMPLGAEILLKQRMTKLLQNWRKEKQSLLCALSVFVQEPLLDWTLQALKQAKSRGADVTEAVSFYPRQTLATVEKKLCGWHPAQVLKEELLRSHEQAPFIRGLISAVLTRGGGEVEHSETIEKLSDTDLHCDSAEHQVSCLLEMATDPSLLVRAWSGWQPWN